MNTIIPATELKENFDEVAMTVHAASEPIFLTRNGYGDMVLMSMEAYDKMRYDFEVYLKLREADREEASSPRYYTSEEVWDAMTKAIEGE